MVTVALLPAIETDSAFTIDIPTLGIAIETEIAPSMTIGLGSDRIAGLYGIELIHGLEDVDNELWLRMSGVSSSFALQNAVLGSNTITAELGTLGTAKDGKLALSSVSVTATPGDLNEALGTAGVLTTRVLGPSPKGSPLTNEEVDTNFLSLEANKLNKIIGHNKLLYTDDTGAVKELIHGPDGYILHSNGPNQVPSWKPNPGEGSGIPLVLEIEGVPFSTNASKLNFEGTGVVVTEPTPDEFTITIAGSGVAESDSEYFPGYMYTYINTTTFMVEGIDVTPLFYYNRRVIFISEGLTRYGHIAAIDYDLTNAGSTTFTMAMENGADLFTEEATEFGLTTDARSWAPLTTVPFDGNDMTCMASGKIGATNFWVVCGENGRLAYSPNQGGSWVEVNTGEIGRFTDIAFDHWNNVFCAVGTDGLILFSTTGTSWAAPAVVPTVGIGSQNDYFSVCFQESQGAIMILKNYSDTWAKMWFTFDHGASWVEATAGGGQIINPGSAGTKIMRSSLPSAIFFLTSTNKTIQGTSLTDTSYSSYNTCPTGGSIQGFVSSFEATIYNVTVQDDGTITQFENTLESASDTTTFSSPLRSVAYSGDHDRYLCVGDNAQIGYLDAADWADGPAGDDQWTSVPNGFNPTSNINWVVYDGVANMFLACSSAGQICVSNSGVI